MDPGYFDVVVVGASIAGCTAAILYARRGLRVALLEAHRDPTHYKRACTHFIQASATPTIRRLGLDAVIEVAGGQPNRMDIWTRWGWISPGDRPAGADSGYNVRRELLDPLLRARAAAEPNVTLLGGHKAIRLLHDGTEFSGVLAHTPRGVRAVRGRLVVGADGRQSTVARLAGVPKVERPHGRFVYFAAFHGVRLSAPSASQMWLLDPDAAYAFPNGEVTVISVMPTSDRLGRFRTDVATHFAHAVRSLPDGPDLTSAHQVTPFSGVTSYACVSRRPTAPGLALVGDAAMVSDYMWGTGCGFAFQSAEWLVEATSEMFVEGGKDLAIGLRRYARRHRARLAGHHVLMSDAANGRQLNAAERLILSAAARDPECADTLRRYGECEIGPAGLFAPGMLARCLTVNGRYRRP